MPSTSPVIRPSTCKRSKFEEDVVGSQMDGPISDLLRTVVEWDNSGIRVTIISKAVSYLLIIGRAKL